MSETETIADAEVTDRTSDGRFAIGNRLSDGTNRPTFVQWVKLLQHEPEEEWRRISEQPIDTITGKVNPGNRRAAARWWLRTGRESANVADFDSLADRTDGKPVPILPVGENGCAAIVFQVLAPTYSDSLMHTDAARDNTRLLAVNEPSVCAMCGKPLFAAAEPMEVPADCRALASGAD